MSIELYVFLQVKLNEAALLKQLCLAASTTHSNRHVSNENLIGFREVDGSNMTLITNASSSNANLITNGKSEVISNCATLVWLDFLKHSQHAVHLQIFNGQDSWLKGLVGLA